MDTVLKARGPKEHSGGPPKSAFIPVSHWGEESFEVHPVYIPDVTANDRLSDMIREREDRGEDPMPFIRELVKEDVQQEERAKFCRVISEIRSSHTAKQQAKMLSQLWWIWGAAALQNESLGSLARKHGVSKQDFQQGCNLIRRIAAGVRSQSARDPQARQKMRMRNARNFK